MRRSRGIVTHGCPTGLPRPCARLRRPRGRGAALVFAAFVVLAPAVGAAIDSRPVRSWLELRSEGVVMQRWDLSCGAAALATVLNYQHGDPVTEREIALGMMSRPEYLELPEIVRLRQGFSLADMRRYVEARGYRGFGYGDVASEDLAELAPAIVPVDEGGYPHFVVFRGERDGRVVLADPAWGTRTVTRDAFLAMWRPYPELGRVAFVVRRRDGLPPPDRLRLVPAASAVPDRRPSG